MRITIHTPSMKVHVPSCGHLNKAAEGSTKDQVGKRATATIDKALKQDGYSACVPCTKHLTS